MRDKLKTVCYSTVFPCHLIAIVLENATVSQREGIMGHREEEMR